MNNSKIFTAPHHNPENIQLLTILGIGVIVFTFLSYLLPMAKSNIEAQRNDVVGEKSK